MPSAAMRALAAPETIPSGGGAPPRSGSRPPVDDLRSAIDLVHLSRQSMGDAALERELLDMFDRQSARLVAQIIETKPSDFAARADFAHKLRGSALALGAGRVASAASAFEDGCRSASGECDSLARALAEAVSEARGEISRLAQ